MRVRLVMAALVLLASAPAAAQKDWLNSGRGILDSILKPNSQESGVGELTIGEITGGLQEALKVGTERVVSRVGQTDGFNADPAIHIPLPGTLKTAQTALRRIGAGAIADDLELRLNRAAEAAAPQAKTIFWQAINAMTLDDARGILNGPQDAATQYFRRTMSDPLQEAMRPVVEENMAQVGVLNTYDRFTTQYQTIPFVPDLKADLTGHVLDGALDGLFHYLAQEEAAIRTNPAQRSTELLKKVFAK